jgi:outer membrane receptor protein involved in Fe transport
MLALWAVTPAGSAQPAAPAGEDLVLPPIEVVQSRADLLGSAATASQGTVTQTELALRPVYRVGQLLETVPGLVVTTHSGEGKANQFFIRGFNLDHGTDFATYVDDMPVNEPTHAHGQGYTDIHFLMPELAGGLDYTKGPFYPQEGDFAGLGSAHVRLTDDLPTQMSVSAGTLGDQRVFLGGTEHFDNGDRLLGALSLAHQDGPWAHPDNYRSVDAVTRYIHGVPDDGFDITAMYYRGQSSFTTDQPVSAYQQGLISRYGTLDPTDGGFSERFSLSGHHVISGDDWKITTSGYVIHSRLTLWNDFTHFLVDPVHGDQEQQDETRTTFGGQTVYSRNDTVLGFPVDTEIGLIGRYDTAFIDRRHDQARVVLPDCPDSAVATGRSVCNADKVTLGNIGAYVQNTTHWLPWFRTVAALREDDYGGTDHSLVSGFSGTTNKTLLQPKGSLIFGPWLETELYVSGGRGFHSNDLRGVLGTVPSLGIVNPNQATPFLTKIVSEEIGLRSNLLPRTKLTAALFRVDFASYLTYDADNGVDDAGPPARLQGIELSAQYRPYDWIELSADLNFTHSRYRTGDPSAYGINGLYIANAPRFIGSVGAIVDNLGPWFGGAELRWLGGYPLVEDNSLRSKGYKEVNLDVGYKFNEKLKFQLSIFNLFNTHAAASQYAYDYQSTPTSSPEFGSTYHPLEPLSARFAVTALF